MLRHFREIFDPAQPGKAVQFDHFKMIAPQ
jgi:hypothetical protein